MLKHVSIVPLAAESLGVRSMCTFVETPNVKILLDAGVSLCPNRFGLPPHPKEFKAIIECRKRIAEAARRAEVVTLSHYHFDHHTPSYEDWLSQWTKPDDTAKEIYEGKTILLKNPRGKINPSQRRRGWMFQKTGGAFAEKLETADQKTFLFDHTIVRFSEPVYHGLENSPLGWVLMTTIEFQGEKFMFAPDVQGPMSTHTLNVILAEKPQLIMLGGPPLYLAGFKADETALQKGLENLQKVVAHVPTVIVEHHILRDECWNKRIVKLLHRTHESKHRVLTAAEFSGRPNNLLEAARKRLFAEEPPSEEFAKWMRKTTLTKTHTQPPI